MAKSLKERFQLIINSAHYYSISNDEKMGKYISEEIQAIFAHRLSSFPISASRHEKFMKDIREKYSSENILSMLEEYAGNSEKALLTELFDKMNTDITNANNFLIANQKLTDIELDISEEFDYLKKKYHIDDINSIIKKPGLFRSEPKNHTKARKELKWFLQRKRDECLNDEEISIFDETYNNALKKRRFRPRKYLE